MAKLEVFADRDALADRAASILAQALSAPGARSFVATGGTTPGPMYDQLANRNIGWDRITVTLSDERWVDPAAPQSNEGLVRRRLLTGLAAKASFLALKGAGATPEADADVADKALRDLAPFAAVLLGMGGDGHIASLFPGAPGLSETLDPAGNRFCVGVDQAGLDPRVPRISLTAAALLRTALVVLLITGDDKRALIARASADPTYDPPVATILRQAAVPVRVLWAA